MSFRPRKGGATLSGWGPSGVPFRHVRDAPRHPANSGPEALEALRGSELILHAGDVGGVDILEALEEIAPVWAVRGNTDYGAVADRLPWTQMVDLLSGDGTVQGEVEAAPSKADSDRSEAGRGDGVAAATPSVLAWILHGHRPLDLDPAAASIRLVVFGHSHLPLVERREGVVFLNPGSAGPRRFDKPVTLARVEVGEDGTIEPEIVPLE